jgi:hypothetical protein
MDINQESILGSFLPNVYITKITLNDDRVILSLMIKENLQDDEELSYLNNDLLKEFINISILQSTNKDSTNQLADDFLQLKDSFELQFEKALLNLQNSNNSKISYDEQGNREIYYDYVFSLDTRQLDHLSYFVFCEINEEEIRKKFNLNSSVRLSYSPNKISNEVVIDDGEVTEESYLYLLPDGSLWAGATREAAENQYFTVEQEPRRLEKNVINNYKVQDFRSRTIKTLSPTSIAINNILATEGQDIINSSFNRRLLNSYSKNKSFIYDIYHIHNSDNTISINFKIDYSELLKQHSPFPSLVNENSTFEQLNDGIISNTDIVNFKLFRRQVKTSINKLKNRPIDIKEPELIVFSGIPEQINVQNNNSSTREYIVTDLDIQQQNYGEFQYYIEAQFQDGIIQFLKNKLEFLLSYDSYLRSYYNSCVLPDNYDYQTDSFTNNLSSVYPASEIANIINAYINTVSQVYNLNNSEINKLQTILSLFTSPTLGNPEGILYFISLYDNLKTKLSQYVSLNNNNSISESNAYSSAKETIFIKKEFNEVVDVTLLNKVKIEYLTLNNGRIDLTSFRSRITTEIAKYELDNTNIYNNQYSTCYLSPQKLYLENKSYDFLSQLNEIQSSVIRSEIQCLNEQKIVSKKFFNSQEEDQKIRNFYNIRNILSDDGVVFEFLKISGSDVLVDDIEYNKIILNDVENLDSSVIISSKVYDSVYDIEQIYNKTNISFLVLTEQTPNQLIKFNELPEEQKDLNKAKNFFDYGMLVEIEYYDDGIWKLLTDSELDRNINQPGIKSINCRLRKYSYYYNKINRKQLFDYFYNQYFVLDLDTEVTDNFITTAVPNPVPVVVEKIEKISTVIRAKELQISQVLPEIKYFNRNNGIVGGREIIIRGNDFKKDLKIVIFKDKVDSNNIVYMANTDDKSQITYFSDKEIRILINRIKNYQTVISPQNVSTSFFPSSDRRFITNPSELNLIIKLINPNGESVEYDKFKLSSDNKVRFNETRTPSIIGTTTAIFDNINKIAGIMDIGITSNLNANQLSAVQETLDYINNNITPISKNDLIKNAPKLTSQEINVKNISSNSKNIKLVKQQKSSATSSLNSIKQQTQQQTAQTASREQSIEIKPARREEKQTILTNKVNKSTKNIKK